MFTKTDLKLTAEPKGYFKSNKANKLYYQSINQSTYLKFNEPMSQAAAVIKRW